MISNQNSFPIGAYLPPKKTSRITSPLFVGLWPCLVNPGTLDSTILKIRQFYHEKLKRVFCLLGQTLTGYTFAVGSEERHRCLIFHTTSSELMNLTHDSFLSENFPVAQDSSGDWRFHWQYKGIRLSTTSWSLNQSQYSVPWPWRCFWCRHPPQTDILMVRLVSFSSSWRTIYTLASASESDGSPLCGVWEQTFKIL